MGKRKKAAGKILTPKKKNPTIRVLIKCPGCKKKIIVSAYRKRTNPTVKAEYDVWTEVTADDQKEFPGMESEVTGTVEKDKKK